MKRQLVGKLNGAPHLVPLPKQAVAVLRDLQPLTGGGKLVFRGERHHDRPMSDNTINAALRAMGYAADEMTAHGFRATARTILHERLGFSPDVIEAQLAHSVRDSLGRAYNRTEFIDQRRKMLQAWADYLDDFGRMSRAAGAKGRVWKPSRAAATRCGALRSATIIRTGVRAHDGFCGIRSMKKADAFYLRNQPANGPAEAARYLRLPAATLRTWLVGRDYPRAISRHLLSSRSIKPASSQPLQLSFYNLIEAHVLRAFRTEHGVALVEFRKAMAFAEKKLQTHRLLLSP